MKVLYCNPSGGAFQYITASIVRCLNSAGIETKRWDGDPNGVRNFRPDLYMGCSGHRQDFPVWARSEFGTKVGIHVNPYASNPMPRVYGNDINESKSACDWVIGQKPDFVYCYADGEQINKWYHLWKDRHGFPIVPMENAGDPILYHPVPKSDEFSYDIGFLGGRWGYKAHNLDRLIKPLLKKYRCGLFGWGGWDNNRSLSDEEGNRLFASSKVCPAVSEPHTTQYGVDIPERVFKIPLSGGFTICDKVHDFARLSGGVIPMAKDDKEWFDLIEYYLKHDDERAELAKKQFTHIMSNHTYYDRMANLFMKVGQGDQVSKLLAYKHTLCA